MVRRSRRLSGLPAIGPIALVREVTDSFSRCVTRVPAVPPLDPALARRQHEAYRSTLAAGGYEVRTVPGDEAHPDGCFIEDAAVVIGSTALIGRSGHLSRRGEAKPVAAALAGFVDLVWLDEGTLDGGDILQVGDTVFAGVGRRTDPTGAAALARLCERAGRRLVTVPVGDALHLKSAMSALDAETLLWHRAAGSRDAFAGFRVIEVAGADPEAANVVRLADGRVLCSLAHQATADAVTGAGFEVFAIDASEFGRADGGLTCLSIRMR